jgi:hypothetical protein
MSFLISHWYFGRSDFLVYVVTSGTIKFCLAKGDFFLHAMNTKRFDLAHGRKSGIAMVVNICFEHRDGAVSVLMYHLQYA